jgi:hypothetical protein
VHRWLCWGYLNERNHSQDLDVDGRIILKCILRKRDGMVWTGLVCVRIETGGGLL